MALLVFPPDNLAPTLADLLNPELRQKVAQRVNQALLQSQGERTKATLYELVSHRSWANQKAIEAKKEHLPERIELDFDPGHNGHESTPNGSSLHQADSMVTGWGSY